ncbi:hypothetical protein AAHC03_025784 [Spirometra sp. Aus1]
MSAVGHFCLVAWFLACTRGQPYRPQPPSPNATTPSQASTLIDVQRSCTALNNVATVARTWTHFSREAYSTAPEYADRQRTFIRYVDRVLRRCDDLCLAQCSATTLARLFKFFFLTVVNLPPGASNCSTAVNASGPSGAVPAPVLSAAKSDVNTHIVLNFWGNGEKPFVVRGDGGVKEEEEEEEEDVEDGEEDEDRQGEKGAGRKEISVGIGPSAAARTEKLVVVSQGGLPSKTMVHLHQQRQEATSGGTSARYQRNHSQRESRKKKDAEGRGNILAEILKATNLARN